MDNVEISGEHLRVSGMGRHQEGVVQRRQHLGLENAVPVHPLHAVEPGDRVVGDRRISLTEGPSKASVWVGGRSAA